MTEGATTTCRHEDCGKRFPLSRYGNQTRTSKTTRKGRHLFCSPRCRVAHHRRMVTLRGGGVTGGVTAPGATRVAGGVTDVKTDARSAHKTGVKSALDTPKITTDPHPWPPRGARHPKAIPDANYPGMWRVRWPDGRVSDLANLSRVNDAIAGFMERQA